MYINHHTTHKGVECTGNKAVTLQSKTVRKRTGHKAERIKNNHRAQLAAEPFFNGLAAAFALDTAIEQTKTNTKREPHNRRNNAYQYKAHKRKHT